MEERKTNETVEDTQSSLSEIAKATSSGVQPHEGQGSWLNAVLSRSALFGTSAIKDKDEPKVSEVDCNNQSTVDFGRSRSLSTSIISHIYRRHGHVTSEKGEKSNRRGSEPLPESIAKDLQLQKTRERAASDNAIPRKKTRQDTAVVEREKEEGFDAGEMVHFLSHGPK